MPEMKIVEDYPPNFELIQAALPDAGEEQTYCWGETIYAPDGHEVPPDIIFHESVHARQQGSDPGAWWMRYLSDSQFRLEQELDAYSQQYVFALRAIERAAEEAPAGHRLDAGKSNLQKRALFDIAQALSSHVYGGLVSYGEAEACLRRYARDHMSEWREEML